MTVFHAITPENGRIADSATVNGLLRCWLRETATPVPESGALSLPLLASASTLHAEVLYRSPTGHHRFGEVRLSNGTSLGAVTVASLLALEAGAGRGTNPQTVTDLVGRVADSATRAARHIQYRKDNGAEPQEATHFLRAEQSLVLGHPLHPDPKSRQGFSESEARRFSPELHGSFALHWFAADRSVVSHGGEALDLLAGLAPEVPDGTVPVPAHPWQAREVRSRPGVRRLLDSGQLHDLGEWGSPWSPTASIRTLYRPDTPVMLKFSLGLPITNSKRENLRKELSRGMEIDRLFDAGLAAEFAATHPRFGVVRDPAWLAVDVDEAEESGLELVIRDNPFDTDDRVSCVAGLVAERPDREASALTEIVTELVRRYGPDSDDIAARWCARYFDEVIAPVLWLYREYGLGLEAHQQNTLVTLDDEGWPCGGWYRDNQGYYISETRVHALERFLPEVGRAGDNRVADAVIDERLGYYIGVNNLLGLVGAFGSQGLADERELLRVLRERLRGYSDLPLARTLAESSTLRCKANMLTRLDGLDELVGPLETQSVYVDIDNPFAEGGTTA